VNQPVGRNLATGLSKTATEQNTELKSRSIRSNKELI